MILMIHIVVGSLLGFATISIWLMMYLESKYQHIVNPSQPQQPVATEDSTSATAEIIHLKRAA